MGCCGTLPHFWSPDSRFIGFFTDRKLKKIDPSGGPAVSLADAPRGYGGTCNPQGTILFASDYMVPISRVSAAGGEATAITQLDQSRRETSHSYPYFLPDGRHFLYVAKAKLAVDTGIYVGSLGSTERKFLVSTSAYRSVAYSPPGYLLFVRDQTLMAQRFDVIQLEVSGEPFPIAEQTGSFDSLSVSENGVLVYQSSSQSGRLVWRDRLGKSLEAVGDLGPYDQVALSPDQKRVAVVTRGGPEGRAIWLLELGTGILSRFTFGRFGGGSPTWSPDGHRLAFASRRNGPASLFQKSVGGVETELLYESEGHNYPTAWSRDGNIIFFSEKSKWVGSVYALSPGEEGKGEARLLVEDYSGIYNIRLSPDEKRISYSSNESGRSEVYLAAFPDFSNRRQVSVAGGAQAQWSGDGKELFFLQLDGKLMSVEIKAGATLETGIPKVLFQTRAKVANYQYCVTSDGQRALFIEPEEGTIQPIHVVLNWHEELRRKASSGE